MLGRADTHVHTKYSGVHRIGFLRFPESVAEPKQVVERARSNGLNVVCITDHNTILGARRAKEYADTLSDIDVVVGEEISTKDGEIIGLFLTEEVPKMLSAEETIRRIKAQGGIVAVPHPFSLHCPAIGEKMASLKIDAVEVLNSGHIDGYANQRAQEFCGDSWSRLGGSDSHSLTTIGFAYTTFEGTTAEDLRRAIQNRTTREGGKSMSIGKVVAWTVDIVLKSDILMIKSIFGSIDGDDPDDPIITRIKTMKSWQKLAAIVGSLIYFTPPVPFLAGITGEKYLQKLYRAKKLAFWKRSDKTV